MSLCPYLFGERSEFTARMRGYSGAHCVAPDYVRCLPWAMGRWAPYPTLRRGSVSWWWVRRVVGAFASLPVVVRVVFLGTEEDPGDAEVALGLSREPLRAYLNGARYPLADGTWWSPIPDPPELPRGSL